jgi:hypothetical protein
VGLGAILIGLLQGGAFWLLHVAAQRVEGPADLPAWWAASALVAFWVPLTLIVLWAHRRNRTLWIAATGLGLFLAWSSSQLLGETSLHKGWAHAEPADIAGYLLPLILAWLIALPMLRARLESGAWRAPYALLFRCSWRSYLLLAESALFSVAFWGLLGLCAALFHTLGNDAFKQRHSSSAPRIASSMQCSTSCWAC